MYTRILVPVDGSATAERGLQEALAWAAQAKSELVLLHVVDDDTPSVELAPARYADEVRKAHERVAEELVAGYVRLAHESGVRAWGVVRDGRGHRACDIVLEETNTQRCQLIVMGTHGRRGFDRFALGSHAESVARRAPVPVLLVRHPQAPH